MHGEDGEISFFPILHWWNFQQSEPAEFQTHCQSFIPLGSVRAKLLRPQWCTARYFSAKSPISVRLFTGRGSTEYEPISDKSLKAVAECSQFVDK